MMSNFDIDLVQINMFYLHQLMLQVFLNLNLQICLFAQLFGMIGSSHLLRLVSQAQNLYEKIGEASQKLLAYKNWMYAIILKPKACVLSRRLEKIPTEIDRKFAKEFMELDLDDKIDYYFKSILYAYESKKGKQAINKDTQILENSEVQGKIKIKALVSYNKKSLRQTEIYIENQYLKSEDASDIDLKYHFSTQRNEKKSAFGSTHKIKFRSIRQNVYPREIFIQFNSISPNQVKILNKAIENGHRKLMQKMAKASNGKNWPLQLQIAQLDDSLDPMKQQQKTKSLLIKKQSLFSDPTFKTINNIQSYIQDSEENESGLRISSIIETGKKVEVSYLKNRFSLSPTAIDQSRANCRQINNFENFMLKGDWTQDKSGDIYISNKDILKEQDAVVKYMMKKITDNLFGGKNLTRISLPVNIFKPESHTESTAKSFALGPYFLQKAAQSDNPLQRMKYVLAFAHTNTVLYFQPEKPFNPILGETYQGFINGCPIYCEQISHHPPITSIYFVGRGYKFYATIQERLSTGLNCIIGHHFGPYNVEFQDGQKITFTSPKIRLGGFLFGKRKFSILGQEFIYDYQNNLFGEISFEDDNGFFSSEKWKFTDQFQGQIYRTSGDFINEFIDSGYTKRINEKQKLEKFVRVQGRVAHFLNFDGKAYYDVNKDMPFVLEGEKFPLESHPHFRKDIYHKKMKNNERSQQQKELLEDLQRHDAKLRKAYKQI